MREQIEILSDAEIRDAELNEVMGGSWFWGSSPRIDQKSVQGSLVGLNVAPRWTWDSLRVS